MYKRMRNYSEEETKTPDQLREELMKQIMANPTDIIQEVAMPGVSTRITPEEDR